MALIITDDIIKGEAVRYITIGLVILTTLCVLIYLILAKIMPLWRKYSERHLYNGLREANALTIEHKKQLFDASYSDDTGRETVSTDNVSPSASISAPLVAVDCDHMSTVCLSDSHCQLLCQKASIKNYQCDAKQHVCIDRSLPTVPDKRWLYADNNNNDEISSKNCNTSIGEYALLQGYNEIGVAQWRCIRLYPGWNDYSRYCQGGRVDLDARRRAPSYRDCTCPTGTTRMVYRRSMIGQEVYGLPHCVTFPHLYRLDYIAV